MQSLITIFTLLTLMCLEGVAQNTIAERLGYSADDKLLIIHGDDLGVAHSKNEASLLALKVGLVNSASIMMPCPWVEEVAAYAREHPAVDFGLHLTLTNEWYDYNWGGVASRNEISSMLNELGHMYPNCLEFGQKADVKEAETELRAQIEKSLAMGIEPTHFDTHMGCLLFNSADLFEVYLKLGREYKVPVMLSRLFLQAASEAFMEKVTDQDIIIENVLSASPQDYDNGMDQYYTNVLNNLSSGVNVLLLHLAFDDSEMQAITRGQEYWGARWRQQDFDFFTSKKCSQLIEENNIKLITWREIRDKLIR